MKDFPAFHDSLTINGDLQWFYDRFVGDAPMFVLTHCVKFEPGFTLRIMES